MKNLPLSLATLSALSLIACNTNTADNNDIVVPDTSSSVSSMEEVGVEVGGAMMLPSRDIVENASNANNVTTLVAAVQAADLVATLKSDGPFTVFAPVDSAFAALPDGTVDTLLLPENKAQLQTVLTYHVVPGRYTSTDLQGGMTLTTVQGEEIVITYENGVWMANDAEILIPDIISSNGVTFAIDSVLMPSATGIMNDSSAMSDDMMDDSTMSDDMM